MLSFFQRTIKSCNVFTSPVNLRYKQDPDYNTFAGGVASIILIFLLMTVFAGSWMALLNKTDISSTTEIIREFDPAFMKINTNDFMFAIGVNGIDMKNVTQKKYFDLSMSRVEMVRGTDLVINYYPFELEACTASHWEQFGEDFVETYNRQDLGQFLCPPKNVSIEMEGKWTSQKFSYLSIKFKKCTGDNCRSDAEVKEWIDTQSSFYFNFFYSNILLNPDQTRPISMFLEDKDYTIFSPTLGTAINIYLGKYIMETDESIFPWIQTKIDQGYIINRGQKQVLNYSPGAQDSYCELVLRKSNIQLQIERKFRKLDDMLSYIGGLFGIIAVAVGVVMKYYGQCSFQLEMCQKIFDYHTIKHSDQAFSKKIIAENGLLSETNLEDKISKQSCPEKTKKQRVIQPKDFGFFDFIWHMILYVPLRKLCNFEWKRMKIYEESLDEMRQKLDIDHLMEKLAFYDRSINALFDESQLKLLYLQQKFNFHDVRNERKMFNLREGLVANLFGMNENQDENLFQKPEGKKELKQIELAKSQRLRSFIGSNNAVSFIEALHSLELEKGLKRKNTLRAKIPIDIKKALQKLDSKIEKGDPVSTRIYNNLQFELLVAYQRNKDSIEQEDEGMKNMRKMRMNARDLDGKLTVKRLNKLKDSADFVMNPSLSSINAINDSIPLHRIQDDI